MQARVSHRIDYFLFGDNPLVREQTGLLIEELKCKIVSVTAEVAAKAEDDYKLVQQFRQLENEDKSIRAIASELGISPTTVLKLRQKNCIRQSKPTVDKCGCLAAQTAGVSSAMRRSGAFARPGRMSAR